MSNMSALTISREQARQFLISYQGLNSNNTFTDEAGVLEYIKRVGCVQYDPLNVVGRNADLVLQSRITGYTQKVLEKLLYADRTLIDGWDKMMCIYSSEDWPFFQRLREEKGKEVIAILKYRDSLKALELTGDVRKQLIQRGPLMANQIKLGEAGKGRWGHRTSSGAAMNYMFNNGELGIYKKKNTQKVFDLIENLLPGELLEQPDPFRSERDFIKWYFKRRVGSIGLLWGHNGGGWLGLFLSDKKLRESILSELVEDKSLITLSIEGIDEPFYMRREDFPILDSIHEQGEAQVRFLAPLDNLLWDRDMVERIFDFKYRWEVYTPEAKRKYGYYVLPVLCGNHFIARFEPEAQRAKEPFRIKQWWWEDGVKPNRKMKREINIAFGRFADFLGTCYRESNKL